MLHDPYDETRRKLYEMNEAAIRREMPALLLRGAGLPHQELSQMAWDMRHMTIADVGANLTGVMWDRGPMPDRNQRAIVEVLSHAYGVILNSEWPNYSQRMAPFCVDLPVRNFKPSEIDIFQMPELSIETEEAQYEKAHIDRIIKTGTTNGSVQTYSVGFGVSHQTWLSNGRALTRAIVGFNRQAANLELRLLAETLTANPALQDGAALFTADNSQADATFNAAALDTAITYLDSEPSGILVNGKAATIRQTLVDCGLSIPVIQAGGLPVNSWYVFGNPNDHGSLARLVLEDETPGPRIGFQQEPMTRRYAFYAAHHVGFSALSRTGVYRGGIS